MNRPVIALVALGIVASFWLLEGAFTRADHRKAVELVRGYRLDGPSLEAFLLAREAARAGPPAWSAEVLSGCRGSVRVRCAVPLGGGAVRVYEFDVDLPRKGLHPADERARDVLLAFESARTDGGDAAEAQARRGRAE